MQRCAFTPYEGGKPYIFISYAHKDSDRVFPVLEELDRRGYRVWYDDGIAPGSEWPENIAQHLDGCALTIAFISPASIASANCRREVTFALSKRKPFLGIMLEETAMSLGMEMQLSAQQCIMKYTYQSDAAFYEKVCSCPDLKPCLGTPKPVAAVQPEPVKTEAKPVEKPMESKPMKPLDKKTMGIIAGAAAAVLLIAILIGVFAGGGKDPNDDTLGNDPGTSEGTGGAVSGDTNETALYYDNQTITAEIVANINQQTRLDQLTFRDCVIQEGAFDALEIPATVKGVHIVRCSGVTNLESLGDLEKLVELELCDSGIEDGMLPAQLGGALKTVDISGNPGITDLSLFAGCTAVEHFDFSDTGVTAVEALAGMENLYEVNGSGSKVKDITALMNLTGLRILRMANCGIETIETPCYSLYLMELDVSDNLLMDIAAFQYCTVLERVNISYNLLNDISILEKNTGLEVLNVSGNDGLYEWDLEFLSQCADLKELYVDSLYLGTLEMVSQVTGLEVLSANGCAISDLSVLSGLKDLKHLSLANNSIEDISPLSGLQGEGLILDLSFNRYLTDISALPTEASYGVLNLLNTDLDLHTMPALQGELLILYGGFDISACPYFQSPGFEEYALVMCPLDQVVKVETTLGKDNVLFIEEEIDYIALLEAAGLSYRYALAE